MCKGKFLYCRSCWWEFFLQIKYLHLNPSEESRIKQTTCNCKVFSKFPFVLMLESIPLEIHHKTYSWSERLLKQVVYNILYMLVLEYVTILTCNWNDLDRSVASTLRVECNSCNIELQYSTIYMQHEHGNMQSAHHYLETIIRWFFFN